MDFKQETKNHFKKITKNNHNLQSLNIKDNCVHLTITFQKIQMLVKCQKKPINIFDGNELRSFWQLSLNSILFELVFRH